MTTIWKFELDFANLNIEMPKGAIIRYCGVQNDRVFLWAEVDEYEVLKPRYFRVYGTGHFMSEEDYRIYIGTVLLQNAELVFHIYEIP